MKNIKIPKAIGNSIARFAYLELIADSIKKQGEHYYSIDLNGYECMSDRVKFTYHEDSLETGDFVIQVRAKNKDVLTLWDVPVNIKDFRFKTLDRIAYEVYDYCKGADDDEYEDARKEYIAGGMDRYREFMS